MMFGSGTMGINYNLKMEEVINKLTYRPRLLLHCCCAPCSSYVLEVLVNYFDITIYYYNPNISPKDEFIKRVKELERFVSVRGYDIKVIEARYDESEFFDAIKGLEELGERSNRCYNCYKFRLDESAKYAKENGFDFFTTTLSISPYKNSDWINEIGIFLEDKYNVKYLQADFKKNNGYKRSIELSNLFDLYRQNYCGCIYSKRERENYENRKNYNG